MKKSVTMGKESGERTVSGRRLYPSLSFLEISLYTGIWISGKYSLLDWSLLIQTHLRSTLLSVVSVQVWSVSSETRQPEIWSGEGETLVVTVRWEDGEGCVGS